VKTVTPRSITFLHTGGMASLPLRELSPELQAKFGYDPAAEKAAEAELANARRLDEQRRLKLQQDRAKGHADALVSKFEKLLQEFGQTPTLQSEVDLRPKFAELSLGIKDQGRRPSCAIFAVVSALEFQNAELAGKAEKFSEEYLIWATRKTTRRIPAAAVVSSDASLHQDSEDKSLEKDEGFALSEVVAALRGYGIPRQSILPNTFGTAIDSIPDPTEETVREARSRRKVYVHAIPGHDSATRIGNLVHALNLGVPVAIGMRWPHYRTLRAGFLSEQKPILDYAHAVTLVGYKSESGHLEDAVFIFKNSYGVSWGEGGYGRVTYKYLSKYMLDAVVLEVQTNQQS
jgi:Papain family cysteine protease